MTISSNDDPIVGREDEPPATFQPDPHLDRLREVYQAVRERLWRALLAWTNSTEVADEAISEAFAQVARRGPAVQDPASWVWRAAFRIAAGEMARRRQDRTTDIADLDPPQPESSFVLPGDAIDLLRALQQLSDQQRQAVVLTDGAGFTAPEAARLLGTSAATIRVQASRARRQLRLLLTDTTPEDHR